MPGLDVIPRSVRNATRSAAAIASDESEMCRARSDHHGWQPDSPQ